MAGDLTTIDAVKAYLDLSESGNAVDLRLNRLITSESARFATLTNNPIRSASFTETRSGDGSSSMELAGVWPRYPLIAITSVVVDGVVVPQRVGAGDGWQMLEGRLTLVGYMFSPGVGNVVVTYTAGYTAVPADVDQAVAEMVSLKVRYMPRIGLMSASTGGETVSFQTLTLPEAVQSVIDAYRLRAVA